MGVQPGQERDDNSLKMKFCWCPPGQFRMGSPANEPERRDDEDQVEVKFPHGFWMAKYPVTQGEWKQLMGSEPSCFCAVGRGKDKVQGMDTSRFPVEQVNHDDATSFAQRFTKQERSARRLPAGWEYRLPTEGQWEYACRRGPRRRRHSAINLKARQANFGGSFGRTCRVGSYPANAWGLYDMHGNVWQWCRDWYGKKLPGGEDPEATVEASARVLRGIGWNDAGTWCRAAGRRPYGSWVRDVSCGFRVAAVQSSRQLLKDEPATPKTQGFIGSRPGQERDDNSLKMKFCWCPPGQFTMGSPADEPERRDDEDQVEVWFPHGFWMAKYAVTQGEWKQLIGTDPSYFCAGGEGKDKVQGMDTSRFPVEGVNYEEATRFAQRFTVQERSRGACCPLGSIVCRRKRSGNMRVARGPRRRRHSAIHLTARRRTSSAIVRTTARHRGHTWHELRPWEVTRQTNGAYTICTATCGNGVAIGTSRSCQAEWILR